MLVMQLFGLVDVSVGLLASGCWHWGMVGAMALIAPVGILLFGIWKCRRLCQEGNFVFGPFPHRSMKAIYQDAMKAKGLHRKAMTLLVDIHDKRYRGDWAKKSDDAKFWGFFLVSFCRNLLHHLSCRLSSRVACGARALLHPQQVLCIQ